MKVFVAGATGVIGRCLVPLLVGAGYEVHGSSRFSANIGLLNRFGARAWIVDVFERQMLGEILQQIQPDVVIHQLTDLPDHLDPALMPEAISRNARIRREGTANLVAATLSSGCRRIVAQSIAWAYAPKDLPHKESDPLDLAAEGSRAATVSGIEALENAVLNTPNLLGVVLRYGNLYGPGTGTNHASGATPVHVDAAAQAALLAVQKQALGIFNICEPNRTVSCTKAEAQLGWSPTFRLHS